MPNLSKFEQITANSYLVDLDNPTVAELGAKGTFDYLCCCEFLIS